MSEREVESGGVWVGDVSAWVWGRHVWGECVSERGVNVSKGCQCVQVQKCV